MLRDDGRYKRLAASVCPPRRPACSRRTQHFALSERPIYPIVCFAGAVPDSNLCVSLVFLSYQDKYDTHWTSAAIHGMKTIHGQSIWSWASTEKRDLRADCGPT